jgi:hypothetical protein
MVLAGNPVLAFHTYKVPNGAEYYYAFTKNNVYKYVHGSASWVSAIDAAVATFFAGGGTPITVSFWSVTDYIDETLGATIVAAGSNPVSDIAQESDSASRVLLYFDTGTDKNFKILTLSENLDQVDENLGSNVSSTAVLQQIGGGASSILDEVKASPLQTLYPGSFNIGTDALGVVAYSDATAVSITIGTVGGYNYGTKNCYLLQPVDQTRVGSGASMTTGSFISVDGTYLQINWLTTDYAGLALKVSYTYQKSSGIKPRYVRGYYNRLLIAGAYETDETQYFPWRVRWGEIGKISLIKYTSYQDLIDTDVSSIMGWEEQGFYLTILKRQCLYKVSHVGGDLVFLFQVAWKHGSPNGRTLQNFNSTQYFLGSDDVYKWDGSALTSITLDTETGNYRVKNAIMGMIQFSNVSTVFSSLDLVNKEYWLWIPGTSTTTVFVYSMSYNTWTKFEYASKVTCANLGRVETTSTGTIDAAVGSFDTYAGTMDESAETLDKIQFFGTSSGTVWVSDEKVNLDFATLAASVYTGTVIPSYLITRDFTYNDVYSMDRTQRVELDLYGSSCTVGWDGNFNLVPTTFKNVNTLTLTPEWLRRYYYPDCVCYQVRFCISSVAFISIRLINIYALATRLSNR